MRKIVAICIFISLFSIFFSTAYGADGFVLKTGEGEAVMNGMVIKASPSTGTSNSILVEQTFQKGAPLDCIYMTREMNYFMSFLGMA